MVSIRVANISVPAKVLSTEVEGETVLLNLESGQYYSLDTTGTRMWALLAQHGRIEPAIAAMLDEYDVSAETLRRDMIALVEQLAMHGLLRVDPA